MKGNKIYILFGLLLFNIGFLNAQKSYIKIKGCITDEKGEAIGGVVFTTYRDGQGKVGDDELIKSNGCFTVWLGLKVEGDWKVVFNKAGYKETFIKVDSRVYGDKGKFDGEDYLISYELPFSITMQKGGGKNQQAFTNVFYDQNKKGLTNSPIMVQKEDPTDENYKKMISEGDREKTLENYAAAKTAFEKALKLKPTEKYPKDQLKELELLMAQKKPEKEQPKNEYAEMIKKADAFFDGEDYEPATEYYTKALAFKPDDAYAKEQLAKIEALNKVPELTNQEIEEKYSGLIKRADFAFNDEDYLNAKINYKAANQLKPNDSYSQNRIETIDVILNEIEKALQEIEGLTKARLKSKEGAEDLINKMELLNYKLVQYEKASGKKFEEAMNKKRAQNLSTKYETGNPLTSLYDVVEEHDKENK